MDFYNLISSIGAFMMGAGVIILVINVIYSAFKSERVTVADPWDARSLEWATNTPVPEYNFAQTPQVRSLDPLFYEKIHGDGKMKPAEPLQDIHMPNGSILPFIISLGLFIMGFGFIMFNMDVPDVAAIAVTVAGGVVTFGAMFVRSIKEDHGYHIPVERVKEIEKEVS